MSESMRGDKDRVLSMYMDGFALKMCIRDRKKDALTDQQVAILLDTVKELPPYLFIMIGLYSGLRRSEERRVGKEC